MTKEEYDNISKRLENEERLIKEAGGFMKAPEKMTNLYQKLAEAQLEYEIENNLLPI